MDIDNDSMEEPLPAGEALLLSMLGLRGNAAPYVMDYLPIRDRMHLLLVSRTIRNHLREIEYYRCKDGRLYKVPFPGFPGLLDKDDEGLFPHQLASLQAMHRAENENQEFGALCGGILGDAPGLGKTITCLALITSTAGKRPRPPPDFWSPQQIREGWQAFSQNPWCGEDVIKAIKPFRALSIYPQLEEKVKPPFPLQRFPTIEALDRYIRTNARQYGANDMELDEYRQNLLRIKAGLHKSNRKVLMSEEGKRQAWERGLVPASATLLIVPDALLEHWYQQIHQHVNRDLFAENPGEGRGVVYLDGVGDIADARMPLGEVLRNNKQSLLPPWKLAKHLIVVTTFSRCEQEYFKEVELGTMGGGGLTLLDLKKRNQASTSNSNNNKPTRGRHGRNGDEDASGGKNFHSSLLNVRWLRVVVDEGHELGTHEGGTGLTRFINQLAAERRWVLSGTPTTGDEDAPDFSAKSLDQLQRLLQFLRHPVYGSVPTPVAASRANEGHNQGRQQIEKAKEAWVTNVKEPFLQKKEEGREELLRVLRSFAVLHRKMDIQLPKPIFRNTEVDVLLPDNIEKNIQDSPQNAEELLAQYIKTNDFQELVDKAQGEYILKAIEKAKKDLQDRSGPLEESEQTTIRMWKPEDIDNPNKDRRPIKAVVYSTISNNLKDVTEYFYSKLSFENVAEAYDDPTFDSGSELSRFRHNMKEVRKCPICGHQNDFEGTAKEQRNPPKCKNFLLEVVKRDNPRVRFLVETERVKGAVPTIHGGNVTVDRLGGLNYSQYALNRKAWRVGDILEVVITDPHPLLKKRESSRQWREWGSEDCMKLAQQDHHTGSDWFFGPLPKNRNGLPTVEVVLAKWQHCGKFHNHSRWFDGPRLANSPLEKLRENTFILSLDAGLATGLDLSFVTHIFLLEPVEDAAMLEQITSRAHRLGATGPVTVETVNPYYKLQPATEAAVKRSHELKKVAKTVSTSEKGKALSIKQDKSQLTKVVCQHCYRAFDSMSAAVTHENNHCAQNPEIAADINKWHISSVYREIRPPPPHAYAQQRFNTNTES